MDHCVPQLQGNCLEVEYQAGTRWLQCATSKGLGVVVREPLRGGAPVRNVAPAAQALWDFAPVGAPLAARGVPSAVHGPRIGRGIAYGSRVQEPSGTKPESLPDWSTPRK
jgi:predicted aldo/keto reductase-like oxidoreductase